MNPTLFMAILALLSLGEIKQGPDDDVREAAFRYMFENNASGHESGTATYCLAFRVGKQNTDPAPEFIRRFASLPFRVRPASACESRIQGVRERETGNPGLIFNLGELRWTSPSSVEIDGGYYAAGLSASGNTYYLEKQDTVWRVVNDVMHWIAQSVGPPNNAMNLTNRGVPGMKERRPSGEPEHG